MFYCARTRDGGKSFTFESVGDEPEGFSMPTSVLLKDGKVLTLVRCSTPGKGASSPACRPRKHRTARRRILRRDASAARSRQRLKSGLEHLKTSSLSGLPLFIAPVPRAAVPFGLPLAEDRGSRCLHSTARGAVLWSQRVFYGLYVVI